MIPTTTARTVERARFSVRVALRCVGALVLAAFVLTVVHRGHARWLEERTTPITPRLGWGWVAQGTLTDSIRPLLMLGIPGGLVVPVEKPAARWLVPTPTDGCANCGYPSTPGLARCPECGDALAPGPHAEPKPGGRGPA